MLGGGIFNPLGWFSNLNKWDGSACAFHVAMAYLWLDRAGATGYAFDLYGFFHNCEEAYRYVSNMVAAPVPDNNNPNRDFENELRTASNACSLVSFFTGVMPKASAVIDATRLMCEMIGARDGDADDANQRLRIA